MHGTCVWGVCDCDEGFGGPGCAIPDCGPLGQCPTGFSCQDGRFCVSVGGDEVSVPASDFWMGCNAAVDGNCFEFESPQHEVSLSPYAIDRTKVTAAAYKACVGAGACSLPASTISTQATYDWPSKQSHPVNYVSFYQASQYCSWRGKRVCTEAEWEKASRGGCETVSGDCRTSMRKYPWGNNDPSGCDQMSWQGCQNGQPTWDVNAFPGGASPYGALEMTGNVMEWTSDWFAPYPASHQTNPQGPAQGGPGVANGVTLRSSVWNESISYARCSRRTNQPPAVQDSTIGFRCCRSLPE
ncbi:MAG: formylglycine-generating enzyme family protein [Myxococcota bacterium]